MEIFIWVLNNLHYAWYIIYDKISIIFQLEIIQLQIEIMKYNIKNKCVFASMYLHLSIENLIFAYLHA